MAIINHKLDLVVRLIDASTGKPVDERNRSFARDGKVFRMMEKGGGVLFLINGGRENFELSVNVYGYEAKKILVDYGALDERMPELIVWLLPKNALSLEGNLKGITSLCAVRLVTPGCFVNSYDAKKNVVTLFNPHKLVLSYHVYGILDSEKKFFEPILLNDEDGIETVKPAGPLKRIPACNDPVERIIEGDVRADGGYCLKVRDDADRIEVLVRYEAEGKEFFQILEMHEPGKDPLDPGKAFVRDDSEETEVKTG